MSALNFTSTNEVQCGSATVIDNVWTGALLAWVYPTNLTGGNQKIFHKGTGAADRHFLQFTATGLSLTIDRATTDLQAIATFANLAALASNTWCFVAASWDQNGVNGDQHLYAGNLTTLAAEAAAYSTQAVGSGAGGSNAASNLWLGNLTGGGQPLTGSIGIIQMLNRTMTLGEIQSWQFSPRWLSGTVGLWILGWNGTTNVPDLSGNGGTGTITGATVSVDPPVYGRWNGAATGKQSYLRTVTSSWPDRRRRMVATRDEWRKRA